MMPEGRQLLLRQLVLKVAYYEDCTKPRGNRVDASHPNAVPVGLSYRDIARQVNERYPHKELKLHRVRQIGYLLKYDKDLYSHMGKPPERRHGIQIRGTRKNKRKPIGARTCELLCQIDYYEDKTKFPHSSNRVGSEHPNAGSVGLPYKTILNILRKEFPYAKINCMSPSYYAHAIMNDVQYDKWKMPRRRPRPDIIRSEMKRKMVELLFHVDYKDGEKTVGLSFLEIQKRLEKEFPGKKTTRGNISTTCALIKQGKIQYAIGVLPYKRPISKI